MNNEIYEECHKCGNSKFEYRQVGPHQGQYCSRCGAWIKWVSKKKKPSITQTRNLNTILSNKVIINDDIINF